MDYKANDIEKILFENKTKIGSDIYDHCLLDQK